MSAQQSQQRTSQSGSTTNGPTVSTQDLVQQIILLKKQIEELQAANQEHTCKPQKDLGEIIRPKQPGPFDGTHGTLQSFLIQLKAYHKFFPTQFPNDQDRVLHAGGCLTGTALAWFRPIMQDYLNNGESRRDRETNDIFGTFGGFEEAITKVFGTVDEEREAEQKLRELRQRTSTSEYAARFRQVVSNLDWDDDPLMARFYDGLKEEVKDELYKENRPRTLSDYIAMAVRIDDRQYGRRQEKRQGRGGWNPSYQGNNKRSNYKKKREPQIAWAHTTNPGLMDLDAAQKGKGKCYNCQKPGHFSRDCKQHRKKKTNWTPVPEGKKQLNSANIQKITPKAEPPHGFLSWTACYDDNCLTHLSDKQGGGWFPTAPKKKAMTTKTLAMLSRRSIQKDQKLRRLHFKDPQHQAQHDNAFEAACALTNLQQERYPRQDSQLEDDYIPSSTTDKQRSIDDTSSEEETPSLTEDTNQEPTLDLLTQDTTEQAPPTEELNAMLDIGTQTEPEYLNDIQRTALKRYHPAPNGSDYTIAVPAVQTSCALHHEFHPREEYGDHVYTQPSHEFHPLISWISCVYTDCMVHFQEKAKNDAFPIRFLGQVISDPYLVNETNYWKPDQRLPTSRIITLIPDHETPMECRDIFNPVSRCLSETCEIHKHDKLEDWHKLTQANLNMNCGGSLLSKCDKPDCNTHLLAKATEWHTQSKKAPAPYWRRLAEINKKQIEGRYSPERANQLRQENETSLIRWKTLDGICDAQYAINCEVTPCERHQAAKQLVHDWLLDTIVLQTNKGPRTEHQRRLFQKQIEEEYDIDENDDDRHINNHKDQAKNEVRHL